MKIYIVEDDQAIAESLCRELTKWGYEVRLVQDFARIDAEVREFSPHLIVMDILLPYFNGYYWCTEIRKASNVPILFLSSKSENMDIVMAVQTGGDDYVTKPFDTSVLLAKIQALLRRAYDFTTELDTLKWNGIHLFPGEVKLVWNEEEIHLTRTELVILDSLFRANGGVVRREKIMEKCWEGDSYIDDNTLAVNVTRVRKKLNAIGLEGLILTKKGIGYGLNPEVGK